MGQFFDLDHEIGIDCVPQFLAEIDRSLSVISDLSDPTEKVHSLFRAVYEEELAF